MKTCGCVTRHGHGDNAICGQPYVDGIYQCSHCQLADADSALAAMTADRDKYKALAEQFARKLYEHGITKDVAPPVKLLRGEIGSIDCGFRFVAGPGESPTERP